MTDSERRRLIQGVANALNTAVSAEWNDGTTVGPYLPQNVEDKRIPYWHMEDGGISSWLSNNIVGFDIRGPSTMWAIALILKGGVR